MATSRRTSLTSPAIYTNPPPTPSAAAGRHPAVACLPQNVPLSYEVYRFGGAELFTVASKAMVEDFFDQLAARMG